MVRACITTVHHSAFLAVACVYMLIIRISSARYWEDPYAFKPDRFAGDWPRDAFLPFSAGVFQLVINGSECSSSLLLIKERGHALGDGKYPLVLD